MFSIKRQNLNTMWVYLKFRVIEKLFFSAENWNLFELQRYTRLFVALQGQPGIGTKAFYVWPDTYRARQLFFLIIQSLARVRVHPPLMSVSNLNLQIKVSISRCKQWARREVAGSIHLTISRWLLFLVLDCQNKWSCVMFTPQPLFVKWSFQHTRQWHLKWAKPR